MAFDRAAVMKKIAESSASSGGNNLLDGRGRLVVKKLELSDKFKGVCFIAEFVVFSSEKIPVVSLQSGQALDISPNPPKTECSWVQNLDEHLSAMGNVKAFALALVGKNESDVTPEDFLKGLEEITDSANPARGLVIDYSTFRKETRENKKEITIPKWAHVKEQNPAHYCQWLDSLVLGQPAAASAA
jgi:hypothetical protein